MALPSFTDSTGQEWLLEITGAVLMRARRENVPLHEALELGTNNLPAFIGDPMKFVSSLALICNPEALGVSPEIFADRLNGRALIDATKAFTEAVVDFSHPSVAEKLRARLRTEMTTAEERITTRISQRLDQWESSNSSSAPPEPPASPTPAPGRSGN